MIPHGIVLVAENKVLVSIVQSGDYVRHVFFLIQTCVIANRRLIVTSAILFR